MEELLGNDWPYSLWIGSLAVCTLVIVYTDIAWYWIPDAAVGAVALSNGLGWMLGLFAPNLWLGTLLALGFCAAYACYPSGMGSGDVKLTAALCLGCTGSMAYGMLVVAFVTALGAACFLRLRSARPVIPFGPFLWIGWWSAFAVQEEWWIWLLLGRGAVWPMAIYCGNYWSFV